MHHTTFGIKRAHLQSVSFGRGILGRLGGQLTPARFDILFLLYGAPRRLFSKRRKREAMQQDIRLQLGLSEPTISKMLQRLEELGLITRARLSTDRRQNLVTLTHEGFLRIRLAVRTLINRGLIACTLEAIFGGKEKDAAWHLTMLSSEIDAIAVTFGDFSRCPYSSGDPDD